MLWMGMGGWVGLGGFFGAIAFRGFSGGMFSSNLENARVLGDLSSCCGSRGRARIEIKVSRSEVKCLTNIIWFYPYHAEPPEPEHTFPQVPLTPVH